MKYLVKDYPHALSSPSHAVCQSYAIIETKPNTARRANHGFLLMNEKINRKNETRGTNM